MIVDLHTYLWHHREQLGPAVSDHLRRRHAHLWAQLDASPTAHAQASEPVDVTVVLGWVSRYLKVELSNESIAEYIAQRPDRRVGFAGLDPTVPGVATRLEELRSLGFAGLTISPAQQDFHPADTRVMPVYEAAAALGLPIVVLQGTVCTPDCRMDYAQPFLFDEVARMFADLKLVLTHGGDPWVEQAMALIGKHRHVYAELGHLAMRPWQLYNVLLSAHTRGVTDRLLFGSVFPFNTPTQAIETIYSLNGLTHGTELPSIPREKLRAIVERDALGCLGLTVARPADAQTQVPAETQAAETRQATEATDEKPGSVSTEHEP